MALITLQDVSMSFGGDPILDRISLRIEPGERVCLVGRNGEGKSTLMKLVAGELVPDGGRIVTQPEIRISRLSQDVLSHLSGTVYDVVAGGLGEMTRLLARHHDLIARMAVETTERMLADLALIEQEMEAAGAWNYEQQIETVLSRLALDPNRIFADLSGGLKRRVLLARSLAVNPDLLLLDEPTNHLDIAAINWLEEYLLSSGHTLLFVTHDRALLKKLATRIIDLDRGALTSWPGSYDTYLRRKEEVLAAQSAQEAEFDRKLAEEEQWIRQGIKARRTRNEGRVRALMDMRRERQARREQVGQVRMEAAGAPVSGKLVAVLKNVSHDFGQGPVIKELSTTVLRGDKIGIIGPNGAGKTTLIRLILGELAPGEGVILLGTKLVPGYFDQQRALLHDERTVIDNLTEGGDFIEINGQPRHAIGYLRDFLFAPDRARSPVKVLSGGERNRLLLAKLFARPANILVLDEPTNDLDMETLELLEEQLLEYPGTVLVVSHDRAFLNNVVTSSLVFEGSGRVVEYAGGYDDWLIQRSEAEPKRTEKTEPRDKGRKKSAGVRRLSFKEARELEALPTEIEAMEEEQKSLYALLADPALYQGDGRDAARAQVRLDALEKKLTEAYARWERLEAIREDSSQQ